MLFSLGPMLNTKLKKKRIIFQLNTETISRAKIGLNMLPLNDNIDPYTFEKSKFRTYFFKMCFLGTRAPLELARVKKKKQQKNFK